MSTLIESGRAAKPAPQPAPSEATTLAWRVVRDGRGRGSWNMALDHALALRAREGVGVLRLYGWAGPTVSFGRHEPARERWGGEDALPGHLAVVRRPTGGRAVLHDEELTYSVVVPVGALGGPRAMYRTVNEALAAALRSVGADVAISEAGTVAAPDAGPCFRAPAPGEVVAEGRKIVGSAQARIGVALLQHGSIILGGDQSVLDRLGGSGEPSPAGVVALSELVGAVDDTRLVGAVVEAFEAAVGGRWIGGGVTRDEHALAVTLEEERYATQEWTWRR